MASHPVAASDDATPAQRQGHRPEQGQRQRETQRRARVDPGIGQGRGVVVIRGRRRGLARVAELESGDIDPIDHRHLDRPVGLAGRPVCRQLRTVHDDNEVVAIRDLGEDEEAPEENEGNGTNGYRGEIHFERKEGEGLRRASVRDFHSFRVTWVTIALTGGVPLELVQKVTGHKTTDIVLKHYFQPGREDFRQALHDAMPKLLTNGQKTARDRMQDLIGQVKQKELREQMLALLPKV